MTPQKTRVLTLIEGSGVSSPAQIVLRMARDCRDVLDLRLVTFARPQTDGEGERSQSSLYTAAAEYDVPVSVVPEAGRFDFGAVAKLREIVERYQPDIVQTNSVKSHFLVSLLLKRSFGWLAFHHGYTSEDLKMRLYNTLDRWSLRGCDQVVTVCQAFARQLQEKGVPPSKISVIPNGIPADFLPNALQPAADFRARFGIEPEESVVLSIGRLSPEKGHAYLIEAMTKVRQNGPSSGVKLLIAGAGLLERTLQEQIHAAGLDKTVYLIGQQADVKPLFRVADVFVLPSLSEGSPMVLLESMSAGVPVVATAVGGVPEALTNDETALLVPAANSQALAAAIVALLTDPTRSRRLAKSAQDHVRDAFSSQLYNKRVLQAFESVLKQKERSASQRVHVPQ